MTTVIERLPGTFTAATRRVGSLILPAYQSATRTELQIGRDGPTSRTNIADYTTPATVMGSPVYHDYWAELSSTGYLESNVGDNAAVTILTVNKLVSPGAAGWIATQFGKTSPFTSIDRGASNSRAFISDASGSTGVNAAIYVAAFDYWQVSGFRVVPGSGNYTWKQDGFHAGALIAGFSGVISQTRAPSSVGFTIGHTLNPGSGYTAPFGMAFAAIIHAAMSDADLLAQAVVLANYYTPLGVAC